MMADRLPHVARQIPVHAAGGFRLVLPDQDLVLERGHAHLLLVGRWSIARRTCRRCVAACVSFPDDRAGAGSTPPEVRVAGSWTCVSRAASPASDFGCTPPTSPWGC